MLYSNPVKPPTHIAEAYRAGLWRFSFDSPNELSKIAVHAPGSAVYIRLRVDDQASVFPLSRKFGADPDDAFDLMMLAKGMGLRPYGITFHVGSQCGNPIAWRQAIADTARLMNELRPRTSRSPCWTSAAASRPGTWRGVPSIESIGAMVMPALDELLPYRPSCWPPSPGGTWSPRPR